jgi:hypothetical protein
MRALRVRLDQRDRGQPLGMARSSGRHGANDQAIAVSMSAWPMKESLASLPRPLRESRASGSVVEAWMSFVRRSP